MQKKLGFFSKWFALVLTTLITACSSGGLFAPYYIDIDQGNIFTEEQIEELQLGMSQRQVRFVMGSPLVIDTLNPNRWEYLYTLTRQDALNVKQHLAIYFEDGVVSKIEQIKVPSNPS